MKLSSAAACLALVSGTLASFTPKRITYDSLTHGDESNDEILAKVLEEVGMISVTSVPLFNKKETLASLPKCAMDSSAMTHHTFPDGTVRRTLATRTVPGIDGFHTLEHGDTESCVDFEHSSVRFRQTAAAVTQAFAKRLSLLTPTNGPLLMTEDRSIAYADLDSVVEGGDHLEHFHSYQAPINPKQDETIEWHTDQGIFLLFTPGLIGSSVSDGFYIQLKDGSREMVNFDEKDDFVILLGDGINQILNPVLDSRSFRATPHSLLMPPRRNENIPEEHRVWYGRMVLPPVDSIHPLDVTQTYGEFRRSMIGNKDSNNEFLSLGCSSTLQTRQLDGSTHCEGDTFHCWHQCMNVTDDISESACADQGLDLACVDPQRRLWNGQHNPIFDIGCVDKANAELSPHGNHSAGGGSHGGHKHPHGGDVKKNGDTSGSGTLASVIGLSTLLIVFSSVGNMF